jgi:hypothetical protein
MANVVVFIKSAEHLKMCFFSLFENLFLGTLLEFLSQFELKNKKTFSILNKFPRSFKTRNVL